MSGQGPGGWGELGEELEVDGSGLEGEEEKWEGLEEDDLEVANRLMRGIDPFGHNMADESNDESHSDEGPIPDSQSCVSYRSAEVPAAGGQFFKGDRCSQNAGLALGQLDGLDNASVASEEARSVASRASSANTSYKNNANASVKGTSVASSRGASSFGSNVSSNRSRFSFGNRNDSEDRPEPGLRPSSEEDFGPLFLDGFGQCLADGLAAAGSLEAPPGLDQGRQAGAVLPAPAQATTNRGHGPSQQSTPGTQARVLIAPGLEARTSAQVAGALLKW